MFVRAKSIELQLSDEMSKSSGSHRKVKCDKACEEHRLKHHVVVVSLRST